MLFILASFFGRKKRTEVLSRKELEKLADEELMLRYADGDVGSFEVLLGRHESKILNFVYRSVGERTRAEEITQDVFLKVVRTAKKYTKSAKFTTWLYTIARNACIDESRRQSKRRTLSLDAPMRSDESGGATFLDAVRDPNAKGGTAGIAREEFRARLMEGLQALPDEQREVFVLRHYDGMRFVDIAKVFDISENTVKSRMRYALATLRGYLADFDGVSFDAVESEELS
ncbi:MAG: RNA polymerase sigma-70 factor (ECF subfamily) [Bradymonadia bacterium]